MAHTSPVARLLLITRLLLPAVLRGGISTAITGGGVLSELGGCVEHGLHLTLRARATSSDTPSKTRAAWSPEVTTPAVANVLTSYKSFPGGSFGSTVFAGGFGVVPVGGVAPAGGRGAGGAGWVAGLLGLNPCSAIIFRRPS